MDKESAEPSSHYINAFFLHEGDLYFDYNGALYVMDLQSGHYELYIAPPNSNSISYDGTNIYYTDQYNRLVIHDLNTGNAEALEQVIASDFLLTPEGIYFLNIRDNKTLYYWNEETQTAKKLDDTNAYELYWDENYCWIVSLDGIHRIIYDGSNKAKVECPGFVQCISTGSAMFMIDYANETLYRVDKDTLQWMEVSLQK